MRTRQAQTFIDHDGQPFDVRIQQALGAVRSPLLARFPVLADDTILTEILEETGRRVRARERVAGPVRSLPAFAWVTAQNVARSRLRRSAMRTASAALDTHEQDVVFESLEATLGSAAEIETGILLRELLERLTPDGRHLMGLKSEGLSGREIAARLRVSVGQGHVAFFRLKGKLAHLLGRLNRVSRHPVKVPGKKNGVTNRITTRADGHPIAEAADRQVRRPPRPPQARGARR